MFRKISFISFFIVLTVILSGCTKSEDKKSIESESKTVQEAQENVNDAVNGTIITFANNAFSPNSVTVKAGSRVTYKNDSDETIEIGSDPHPVHSENQELSGGAFVLSVAPGGSKTVTLNLAGSWGYHDHKKASRKGTIVVE